MDTGMETPLQWNIIDLAGHLRQERLFVSSEQQNLQALNEKVVNVSSRLAQLAWVTAQQRDNLNRLVVAHPDCTPAVCCQRANTLETTIFVDGYKVLGFQECMAYGEFLQALRASPQLLASCLVAGDRLLPDMMHGVTHSLVAGLFGSCLLPEDKVLVLRILRHLTQLQLALSDNPRRLLRHKSCALARLYSEFHEGLFSAKLFLTAALHRPVMALLVEHELFLDVDPDKATLRFPPDERLKRFGVEGTPEHQARLRQYRDWTNRCLVATTNSFVASLRENLHCFPAGVSWLVRQIAAVLTEAGTIPAKEVNAICTDLVFTHFVCPAIVNPEPYGITDAPISYVSQHNLIQVAKIVQTLAMVRYEEIDRKVADLFSLFNKDCVSSLLDTILDGPAPKEGPAVGGSFKLQGLTHTAALYTESELHNLVVFLQTVSSEVQTDETSDQSNMRKQLASLLAQLPLSAAVVNGHGGGGSSKQHTATTEALRRSPAGLVGKGKMRSPSTPLLGGGDGPEDGVLGEDEAAEEVLVLPFTPGAMETVGLLSEQKVLCMGPSEPRVEVSLSDVQTDATESHEKRTRFSLSHDDGSIGNTSDNLEAVSEAASNHSVASSLELEAEDPNDNLSDMVSANVSGRGTPNISGRDTPSSQITEGEEGPGGVMRGPVGEPRQPLDFPPPSANKQSRTDIDDKFGKFEIKKLLEGDETVSMVSDTWSTDVLASDSETVEQPEIAVQQLVEATQLLDVSETASEAWSTDVLASDSERLTEVDTDDTGSVARSDDTASVARSEVEADGRVEQEAREDTPPSSTSVGFQPIREAPPSPTRSDRATAWNVTGRGGARSDYRRRTLEYVDNNRREEESRLIHVIDKIPEVPVIVPIIGEEVGGLPNGGEGVRLSSASSSSSGSEPRHTPTPGRLAVLGSVSGELPDNAEQLEVIVDTCAEPLPNGLTSKSTGAIPKSISFDKTADKEPDQRRSFFRGFKLPFRGRRGKERGFDPQPATIDGEPRRLRRGTSEEGARPADTTGEDILAKYRRKPPAGESCPVAEPTSISKTPPPADERLAIDPANVEASYAFADAKRKLRMVLSNADLHHVPWPADTGHGVWGQPDAALVSFLQLQLAEAINLQDRGLAAHLHETLRCIRLFDASGCRLLLRSLHDNYQQRAPFIAYLVRCRQGLLATLAHLERLMERVRGDRTACGRFLVQVCVALFLERREQQVADFSAEFQQLTLADEKTDLLERFLATLCAELERDATWQAAGSAQLEQARTAVERAVMGRVYLHALYPNGDGDVSRDQVLHEHMKKLGAVITPDHKDLRVPKVFHYECPWPSAQAEIAAMSAYKTPSDKVACVNRCAATIMNLLAMACERGVPAADDFVPVLVYVLIKANPPSLLSTVEYVNSFYGTRLKGEEQYWWTQFCSAIEFIKTMDYGD